jgi:glutamine synthetase
MMFATFEDARSYIKANRIRAIDLKYCDLWGKWHHITVPTSQFTSDLMAQGIGFDGSSVGLKNVKAGDMILKPDLKTGFLDPFWDCSTLSFICITLNADTHEIFPNDPRNLARQAELFINESGIATDSRWGPEFEFYIFDEVTFKNTNLEAGYRFNTQEAEWCSGTGRSGAYIPEHGGYHVTPPRDRYHNMRQEIVEHLEAMGVAVKYHHHEVGCAGQMEIETPMMGLVPAGDVILLAKYTTKMVASQHGKAVTFMPKPIFGEAGNGLHFHQQIFKGDLNLFFDPSGYGYLSQTARYYIGGLLHHGGAVLALTNPSTNSYRRLVPGFEAPINAFYSLGNRSAAIRIPKYAKHPDTARFEFRPPDATSNPYLAMAAQLMAGIDGIIQKMDPTELGFGPIDADVFAWTDEQRASIKPLPTSLSDALCALEQDHDFLLTGDVFSLDLIESWIDHKHKEENQAVLKRPHPYEMSLYFDV